MIWRSRTREGLPITVDAPNKQYARQQFDTLYGRGNWGPNFNCIRNDAAGFNAQGSTGGSSSFGGLLGGVIVLGILLALLGGGESSNTPTEQRAPSSSQSVPR